MPAVFVLIWSTGFIVARYGMPNSPPFKFLVVRYALSPKAKTDEAKLAQKLHDIAEEDIALRIEHDDRHSWVDGAGLQRALGTRDRDDVLAARMPGRWRRDDKGELMLRVDAVVEHLARRPERMDPRVVRLRVYLEREVLFPATERRRRSVS